MLSRMKEKVQYEVSPDNEVRQACEPAYKHHMHKSRHFPPKIDFFLQKTRWGGNAPLHASPHTLVVSATRCP